VRGISSVVDVSVFLLLVSAAVATLTLVPSPAPEPVTVDESANVLGAATAEVDYRLGGEDRRAHGTVASLLARGTVANTSVDGRPLSDGQEPFLERVRTATRRTLGPTNRTAAVARWAPYRGSPLRGTLRVGTTPPPGRGVTVATLTVPVPTEYVEAPATARAKADGFRGVAAVAARETASVLLPRTSAALPSGRVSPASTVASSRFRVLAEATGVSVSGPLSNRNVSLAYRRVVDGLTGRFAADMRDRFESPAAATTALRVGTVRITLRRWEA
jgi:hypothetical protein